jgi:hypothetical protein
MAGSKQIEYSAYDVLPAMQQHALDQSHASRLKRPDCNPEVETALPLCEMWTGSPRIDLPRVCRYEMPGVRRQHQAIPQNPVRTALLIPQNAPVQEMQQAVPDVQLSITFAACSPVVIAPSMKGPNK